MHTSSSRRGSAAARGAARGAPRSAARGAARVPAAVLRREAAPAAAAGAVAAPRPTTHAEGAARDQDAEPYPTTLAAFLRGLRRRAAAQAPREEVLAWVHRVADAYGVRVRTDGADPLPGTNLSRVILSIDKKGGGGAYRGGGPHRPAPPPGAHPRLYYECNGLVLDATTWQPLAVPPLAFSPDISARRIDPYLAAASPGGAPVYDIISVDDGTVVTFYYWPAGQQWCMASSNGYDVSSLYWIGEQAYAEVIHDIATKYYPDFAAETGMRLEARPNGGAALTFDKLSTESCYTLGFRSHNFHPIRADPERMWQIQSVLLGSSDAGDAAAADGAGAAGGEGKPSALEATAEDATPSVIYGGCLPVIPTQTVYDAATLRAKLGLPEAAPLTLERLQALGADSLANAVQFIGGGAATAAAAGAATAPPQLYYGLILRARIADAARQVDFPTDHLIESPLLRKVRSVMYERAPRTVRDKITADDRQEYNAMRAYLTLGERARFLELYPQWKAAYARYDEFTKEVVGMITGTMRTREMPLSTHQPELRSPTGIVAHQLCQHILAHEPDLRAFPPETPQVIADYVHNPEHALLYLRAVRRHAARGQEPEAGAGAV